MNALYFLAGMLVTLLFGAWCARRLLAGGNVRIVPGLSLLSDRITSLQTEAEESRLRLKVLTDNLAAAVILHDTRGSITWCNPFTEVLTGYSRDELYARTPSPLESLVLDQDSASLRRAFDIIANGEAFQFRCRLQHKSGLTLWGEWRTVPLFDEERDEYVALSIVFDVTRTVTREHRIEAQNRDIHDFTYMVTHDLKGPIATIRGMLGILEEEREGVPNESVREAISHMERATKRLEMLAGGIIQLAKMSTEVVSLAPVPLVQILQEVSDEFAPRLAALGGALATEGDLPSVLGEPLRLYQIIANVIDNAIKYRDPTRPLQICILGTGILNRTRLQLRIEDNGLGIAEDKLDRIFRPFERLHPTVGEGSGVGLATVKKLVELLDGTISVESAAGFGTAFIIELRSAEAAEHYPTFS